MRELLFSAWRNSATAVILGFLANHDIAMSNTMIVYNLGKELNDLPSRATINRALSGALDAGAVHQPEGALYEITNRGREWLVDNTNHDDFSLLTKDSNDTPGLLG